MASKDSKDKEPKVEAATGVTGVTGVTGEEVAAPAERVHQGHERTKARREARAK
jgi:hypothetical protein